MYTEGSDIKIISSYPKHSRYNDDGLFKLAAVLTALICIQEVPGLNLGKDTTNLRCSMVFPQPLQADAMVLPPSKPLLLSSTFWPINLSLGQPIHTYIVLYMYSILICSIPLCIYKV
jgi:hypothetical protein